MIIRVIIPPHSAIRRIIRDKYTDLYRQFHRKYPTSTAYARIHLLQNIRNAISVGRTTVTEYQLTIPIRNDWRANGWYVIPCHEHWYFAVILTRTKKGIVRAEIQDCCYEGDYHNDVLTSKPYESIIKNWINSLIIEVLNEYIKKNIIIESKKNKVIGLNEQQMRRIVRTVINKIIA